MAKKRFRIKDKQGNPVDYDISSASVTIDVEGKSLDVKLSELANTITAAVTRVVYNDVPHNVANGAIDIGSQMQADWNESSQQYPAFIKNKPNVVTGIKVGESGSVRTPSNGVVTIPEGGSTIAPDNEMSEMSENVVKNKVIKAYVDNLINGLINGAPAALDTLKELADALADSDDAVAALTNLISTKANSTEVVKSISVNDGTPQTPTNGNVNIIVGGEDGEDGITPHIGQNGNWWIGPETVQANDTGIKAQGPKGDTIVGASTTIVNNVNDGGETDALSAEMGKVLRINLMAIYNALGAYAFPGGKPTLNWGSTVINYNINVNGVTGLTITNIEVNGVAVQSMPQKIEDGKSLSFTLTKGSSQIYRGVSISMGGTNITENTGVWDESTGEVTISNVTGDIVISASSLTLVEYLQSDGNQWIDTGIIAAANFKSEIKADILSLADSSWHRLLAARDANARYAIAVGLQPTSSGGKLYSQFGTTNNTFITTSSSVVTGLHTFITQLTGSALSFSVDGVSGNVETTAVNQIALPSLSQFMFSNHREDSTVESISAKVYYCKIWNGSDLVFDAVPVRVGQVGYMYDKVSDTLLGNIGTGSFTLGNDLTV